MDLDAIRVAFAERLDTIPGLRAFAYQPDQVPVGQNDVAVVNPGAPFIEYQGAMARGLATVRLVIVVLVQMTSERAAFQRLNALISGGDDETRSLIDTLMQTDRTLGGVIGDLVVDDVTNVAATEVDGARFLAADFNVTVLTGRT